MWVLMWVLIISSLRSLMKDQMTSCCALILVIFHIIAFDLCGCLILFLWLIRLLQVIRSPLLDRSLRSHSRSCLDLRLRVPQAELIRCNHVCGAGCFISRAHLPLLRICLVTFHRDDIPIRASGSLCLSLEIRPPLVPSRSLFGSFGQFHLWRGGGLFLFLARATKRIRDCSIGLLIRWESLNGRTLSARISLWGHRVVTHDCKILSLFYARRCQL